MSRTIIDLGAGRQVKDWWWDAMHDVDWRTGRLTPEARARKAQAIEESMWTRPMKEPRAEDLK